MATICGARLASTPQRTAGVADSPGIDPAHLEAAPALAVGGLAAVVDDQDLGVEARAREVAPQRPDGLDEEPGCPVVHQDNGEIAHAAAVLAATARWR
jgi:hypothetical protein